MRITRSPMPKTSKHPLPQPISKPLRYHRSQIFTTKSPSWQQINHQKYQPCNCRFGILLLSKLRRGEIDLIDSLLTTNYCIERTF